MYYIRQQTKISGPFPPDQVKAMLRRGRIVRSDKVSTDRETWQAIADCPELIERPAPAPAEPAQPAAAAAAGDGYQWFYTRGGDQQAESVDTKTLTILVASGAVRPDDVVWREGFADWTPVSAVAEFATAAPGLAPPGQGFGVDLPPIVDDGQFRF